MNSLSVFEFESNEIRVVVVDNEPWFVASDIAKVLEHSQASKLMLIVKEREKGRNLIPTPGGTQEMAVVSESGLYRILMRSDKPNAELFQDWIAESVIPQIRKTGAYLPQMSTSELLAAIAQQNVEIEKRIIRTEAELGEVQQEVRKINQRAIAAEKELKSLPAPEKTAQSRTARSNINSLIRGYCHRCHVNHTEAYKNLYREFRDRYHIDLRIRAANGKSAPLDIAESLEVMDDLYALASEMFGGENV